MRWTLLFLALSSTALAWTKNGNVYTTDGSQGDVRDAIDDSSNGDVVNMPAGSFTWGQATGATTISNTITLQGAGTGSTTIVCSDTGPTYAAGIIRVYGAATLKSFSITGSNVAHVTPIECGVNGWRITDIVFNGGTAEAYFVYVLAGYGLIDHCTVTGNNPQSELIFVRGPSDSWTTPSTMGTVSAVYIEDCVFNTDGYVCDANANSRVVVRFCTVNGRNMKVDGHGLASNTPAKGVRQMEVYNNSWTYSGDTGWTAIELRGGTGMVFDNTSAVTARFALREYGCLAPWPNFGTFLSGVSTTNPTTITTTNPHGYTTGWPVFVYRQDSVPTIGGTYTATVTGASTFTIPVNVTTSGVFGLTSTTQTPYNYPITDQIGVGQDPKTGGSEPMYLVNNVAAGADWAFDWSNDLTEAITLYRVQISTPAATFTMQNIIAADRDYFKQTVGGTFNGSSGAGRGTAAQMAAITGTTTGVGFWVTDQGNWRAGYAGTSGQLYRWNGSAWALHYTPYTYPHPLQGSLVNITVNRLNVGTLRF